MLLANSNFRAPYYSISEAQSLVWYGKKPLQDPLLDKPSNEIRSSGHEFNDPRYEVKVLRKTPHSQDLKSFDRSKGQVVALVSGQALNCGIGPCPHFGDEADVKITYLSAKDVMRWSKLSEWLDKYEQQNPTDETALSQSENLDDKHSLWWKLRAGLLRATIPEDSLSAHVSDLPGKAGVFLDSEFWVDAMAFVVRTKVLLTLLVALPLVYGGIHLTTWKFHFASQTELLLWKIACIDIMGTIPLGVIFYACIHPIWTTTYPDLVAGVYKKPAMGFVLQYITWTLFCFTFIFYTLSRIYIVVESFISLRHVPIGVYAAIPWVQDIPHV